MCRKHRRTIAWILIVIMTYSPALVYAQTPTDTKQAPAGGPSKIDLSYVTPESCAAVVLFPRRVLTAPAMEMLPIEVMTAAGIKEMGIDPLQIEQIVAIAEPPVGGPPGAVVVVRMASPLAEGKILGPLWDRTTEDKLNGKTYRKGASPMDPCIYRPDDRTLLVGTDDLLRKVVANHASPKEGKMSAVLGRMAEPPDALVIVLVEPIRPLLAMPLAMAPVPPQLEDVRKIPDLLTSVGAKLNVSGEFAASLSLKANDEAAAQQIEQIIDKAQAFAREQAMAEAAKMAASSDPVEQAMGKYQQRTAERMTQGLRPVRNGATLTLATTGGASNPQLASVAVIGILVALLLPAVQAAREAARRVSSVNNLKQIGLAMHNYYDAKKQFPARANFDKEGKPLLSWRVHVLPYIEEGSLYKQFHLDEPWDSEHNRQLIPKIPELFRNPSGKAAPGMANYLAVCGEGLAFDGTKGRKLAEFKDGLSNTIMVVEVNDDRAAIWTKPDDWQYDAKQPMAGLGKAHPNSFNALFVDGSVRVLASNLDPQIFHALLTIAGGESLPPGAF